MWGLRKQNNPGEAVRLKEGILDIQAPQHQVFECAGGYARVLRYLHCHPSGRGPGNLYCFDALNHFPRWYPPTAHCRFAYWLTCSLGFENLEGLPRIQLVDLCFT